MSPNDPPLWLDALVALLALAGGVFALLGSIGLVRLPDAMTRLHGPTKATTLGVGGVLLAAMLGAGWSADRPVLQGLLITAALFVTAPVSAHLLGRALLRRGQVVPPSPPGASVTAASGSPDATARPPVEDRADAATPPAGEADPPRASRLQPPAA